MTFRERVPEAVPTAGTHEAPPQHPGHGCPCFTPTRSVLGRASRPFCGVSGAWGLCREPAGDTSLPGPQSPPGAAPSPCSPSAQHPDPTAESDPAQATPTRAQATPTRAQATPTRAQTTPTRAQATLPTRSPLAPRGGSSAAPRLHANELGGGGR